MNDRVALALLCCVAGAFVGAVLLALFTSTPGRAIGALLIAGGLTAVTFARVLASAQQELSKKPYIPQHWEDVRPTTFVLWGAGVTILGVFWVAGVL